MSDLNDHLAADQVVNIGVEFVEPPDTAKQYALIHYSRDARDYGDHTTSSDYWGLRLWGSAIAPSEVTDSTLPKPFFGEDEYGRFAFVQVVEETQPVNFIVNRGDLK